MDRRAIAGGFIAVLTLLLAGCGGGVDAPERTPPAQADGSRVQVGPLMVEPADASGLQMQVIPNDDGAGFVALSGSTVTWMGIQQMLDRIVFVRGGDLWLCDLFGGNEVRLTTDGTDVDDRFPDWSPTGARIAWQRAEPNEGSPPPPPDSEIVAMKPDGSNWSYLTDNTAEDRHPSWAPDGRELAFDSIRGSQRDVYVMDGSGSNQAKLTDLATQDYGAQWAADGSRILFVSTRDGNREVYRMDSGGSGQTRLTDSAGDESGVCDNPLADELAWALGGDIYTRASGSATRFTDQSHTDAWPAYSTGADYICFASDRGGSTDLWLQQTTAPHRLYQVTTAGGTQPDPGGRALQVGRVLVGAAGEDRGYDPTFGTWQAGIVAFDGNGYLNSVVVDIPTADLPTLTVTPLPDVGDDLVGVTISADHLDGIAQDAGAGREPIRWEAPEGSEDGTSAATIYLDAQTGEVSSVAFGQATSYPAGAGGQP